jgi:hypothetical protein
MRSAWNAGNILTAVTMGRSLIETGAVVRRLSEGVKDATKNKDVDALDRIVMDVGFGNRMDVFDDQKEQYKAVNILTVIASMDKNLFHDKAPRLMKTYEFLSEFAHPNHFGILGLYSDNITKEYRIEFGVKAEKRERTLPNLRVTLSMVWLVEIEAKLFEKMLPTIREFCP